LNLPKTLRNAVLRQGPGTPVKLHADDFEVEEFESTRRSATVFAIDLSLSMAMRSNLVPAKKMVLALTSLIRSKFHAISSPSSASERRPRNSRSKTSRLSPSTTPTAPISSTPWPSVVTSCATNEVSVRSWVVTDGEPTAHLLANGEPFFAWPPVRETLEKTMAEVLRCTKAGITINTFALDIERSQFPFVEQIAKVNGGRLFYTDVDDLGSYALDDFVKHRRAD